MENIPHNPHFSYDFGESQSKADYKFQLALENLRLQYKLGKIPKINKIEREILEFCHERDMKEFLREEFEKHPIILDEDGGLVGANPFNHERHEEELRSAMQQESDSSVNNADYEIF